MLPATIPGKSIKSRLTHSGEYSSMIIRSSVTPVTLPFAAATSSSIHVRTCAGTSSGCICEETSAFNLESSPGAIFMTTYPSLNRSSSFAKLSRSRCLSRSSIGTRVHSLSSLGNTLIIATRSSVEDFPEDSSPMQTIRGTLYRRAGSPSISGAHAASTSRRRLRCSNHDLRKRSSSGFDIARATRGGAAPARAHLRVLRAVAILRKSGHRGGVEGGLRAPLSQRES